MKKIMLNLNGLSICLESDDENADTFIEENFSKFLNEILPNYNEVVNQKPNLDNELKENISKQEKDTTITTDDYYNFFGIEKSKFDYLFSIKGENVNFLIKDKILGSKKAEKQLKITLLYAGICQFLNKECNTKDIREICDKKYKCLDPNFAPNIKKGNNYFNFGKGVNCEVTLTAPGEDKLKELMKELSDTNEQSN